MKSEDGALRILVVDDHVVFREGTAAALAAQSGFLTEHCGSVSNAIRIMERTRFDVVLLDHDLGTERSWQFFEAAARAGFDVRILIVTAWLSEAEARRLLRSGAAGVFRKENSLAALTNAIRAVVRGEIWLDERYMAASGGVACEEESGSRCDRLDEKERRVLRYVLEGLSNKEIAWNLSFSESYVKAILQRLFQRAGVRTRGQLVRAALERYNGQF